MRVALIGDTFPPARTSGAVQLYDLAREFVRQGHELTMMVPTPGLAHDWELSDEGGVQVLRLRAMRIKDVHYVPRTIGESVMPYMMLRGLRKSPLAGVRWDGVVCYAPSIFHGPFVRALKSASQCRAYLIVRDIFPEWAVDLGLMLKNGIPFHGFKAVANYLYSVVDTIGVQTEGNLDYFRRWQRGKGRAAEVLPNWLADRPIDTTSLQLSDTLLAGRKVFVYAGNMGVAQGVDVFLDLAHRMRERTDIGFLFVGRGSEVKRLEGLAASRRLENVVFHDEIPPDEIPALLAQCHVGLIALNPRHKSHNIPGKFIACMQAGLPVLATVNPGNDLVKLIETEHVGAVSESTSIDELERLALALSQSTENRTSVASRSRCLYERLFAPTAAVRQIVTALTAPSDI